MAAAEEESRKQNILMFPFMAQGHIIPFLALALHLEKTTKQTTTITLINTPKNIKNLKLSIPKASSIQLLEIPFNSEEHGLPPDAENCDSLPYNLVIRLLEASISLKDSFKKILFDFTRKKNGETPLCVIGDIFLGWMAKVCNEFGVYFAIFSGAGGFGLGCYYSIWVNLPHKKVDEDGFLLDDFLEAGKIHRTRLNLSMTEADGTDPWSLFQHRNLTEFVYADAILFNTVEELDQIGLLYFKRKLGLPVWAVGPVLLSSENRAKRGEKAEDLNKWLDAKPEKSVLYISFGSMNTISHTHMMSLAMALEVSEKNFIWVVRPPIGFDINGEFRGKEWLPEGFEERMKVSGKGVLVPKWAPQVDILSHKATSAFLSHCGWNSILESLSHGVPLLGWPMAGEQFFNSKFLEEEVGVCVEVARGKSCEVRQDEIASKINLVMEETEKGSGMRRKAHEVKAMIERAVQDEDGDGVKGSSIRSIDDFLGAAILKKKKNDTI